MAALQNKRLSPDARFWCAVKKLSSGCWEWQLARDYQGYGIFALTPTKMVRAHRYSLEQHLGRSLSKLFACHHCNNPACVRPAHLYAGTNQQNQLDAKRARNGKHTVYGERHGQAKLSTWAVRVVKRLKKRLSSRVVGQMFGVSHASIQNIWAGITRQEG